MRRLREFAFDKKHQPIFKIPDVISLLADQRDEAFEGERALRLFQFRTWLLFPDPSERIYPISAGFIAAVKYLERFEEDYFYDNEAAPRYVLGKEVNDVDPDDKPKQTLKRVEHLKAANNSYRAIYDQMIGRSGGLMGVLKTPPPWVFDSATDQRIERIGIVSNLVDIRLRWLQHGRPGKGSFEPKRDPGKSKAMFFCYWPTHDVAGKRGRTAPSKSVSVKTMRTWWSKLEYSALFLYLIHQQGFKQLPSDTNTEFFIEHLLKDASDTAEQTRFFGAYAYLVDTFKKADSDLVHVGVPDSIKRIKINTRPFSQSELRTISEYEHNYLSLE